MLKSTLGLMKYVVILFFSLFSFIVRSDDSITNIKNNHSITFSYLEGEFPFSYTLAGKPTGIAIDLCKSVAEHLGKELGGKPLEIHWIKVSPAARFQSLLTHKSDVECSNITNTSDRRQFLLFSMPYFYASTAFISHKEDHLGSIKMLSGHTIFVTSGDIAVEAVAKLNVRLGYSLFTHLSQSAVSGFEEMKVTNNSVFVADDVLLYSLKAASAKPGCYNISQDNLIAAQPFALALPRQSITLQKAVNNAMMEMFFTNEFDKIYNKWFLSPVPPDNILINMPMPARLKQEIAKWNVQYPSLAHKKLF
ncbi:transporter substrate-binding domain-containing protein [Buttiauxella sp. S04-F03]|uniref:transporter substrate-binding domain-containing protein n=1 Tax=Buttiauxella sp. W03-F01 TaxID=2904524 RepID=UPI001E43958B|nr:transporter substrate-binding domain-containing protein [Buttiauxella sp. W03-F01]MCE0801915.1 transporter substrate-binding domain-containing protein [Buttiauxella sp. W03-F01]